MAVRDTQIVRSPGSCSGLTLKLSVKLSPRLNYNRRRNGAFSGSYGDAKGAIEDVMWAKAAAFENAVMWLYQMGIWSEPEMSARCFSSWRWSKRFYLASSSRHRPCEDVFAARQFVEHIAFFAQRYFSG